MNDGKLNLIAFIKGSSVLVLANFVMKAIQFLLLPIFTKYLSPETLGVSDVITTFTAILLPIFVMGLDSAYSAFYFDEKTDSHYKKVFNTILFFFFLQCLILAIIAFSLSDKISLLLFDAATFSLGIKIAIVSVMINILFLPFSLWIRMENRMKVFAFVNIMSSVISVLSNIVFVAILQWGYLSLILSATLVNIIQLVMYICFAKMKIQKKYVSRTLFTKMFIFALPLVPLTVFTWLLNMSDRWLLLFFIGEEAVGLYGIGSRFIAAISAVIGGVAVPYTTFAFQNSKDIHAKEMFSNVINLVFVILIIIATSISIFGKEIIELMTSEAYHSSYTILAPLLFAQIIMAMNTFIGYGIIFEKKSKFLLLSISVGAIVNIFLNILFIPMWGILAAAAASFLGYVCIFILTYFFSQKLYPNDYKIKSIILLFFFLFVTSIIFRDFIIQIKIIVLIIDIAVLLFAKKSSIIELVNKIKR